MSAANQIVSAFDVEKLIRMIRGHKVMLDADLAKLYGVETRVLIQAVKRNSSRFPADFMFPLSSAEAKALRSQTVISKKGRGGRRYLPYSLAIRSHPPVDGPAGTQET